MFSKSSLPASRKLIARQKELVVEFAKTESLVDGVVQGAGTVQHCSCSQRSICSWSAC